MNLPELIELERLLAEAPASILDPGVSPVAIVNDALMNLGMAPLAKEETRPFVPGAKTADRDAIVRLACRLLGHPFFGGWASESGDAARASLLTALSGSVAGRAAASHAERFAVEVEGREELSRILLSGIGTRPAGETAAQAEDRLKAVDSIERKRVMERAQAAEKRSRDIREAMERREAEEAASKMQRD
ncbi:MAG: hypothetical protein NT080_00080 [Spirochaetes bacterium]|nr:hypothetical protein [Spirochaetota bacterium]